MATILVIRNGIPTYETVSSNKSPIYDKNLLVTVSGDKPGEILGPIATGILITLPEAQSYEDGELEVFFNGKPMEELIDYNIIGAGPTRTQISFTFDIQIDDIIRLKVDKK